MWVTKPTTELRAFATKTIKSIQRFYINKNVFYFLISISILLIKSYDVTLKTNKGNTMVITSNLQLMRPEPFRLDKILDNRTLAKIAIHNPNHSYIITYVILFVLSQLQHKLDLIRKFNHARLFRSVNKISSLNKTYITIDREVAVGCW